MEESEKVKSGISYIVKSIGNIAERNRNIVTIILTSIFIVSLLYITKKQMNRTDELLKTIEMNRSSEYVANYKQDMGFLSCISEQHNCLFKNLKSNDYKIIIDRCKDENFCAVEYSTSNR